MRGKVYIPVISAFALGRMRYQGARPPIDAPKLDLVRLFNPFHQCDDDVPGFVLGDHDGFQRLVVLTLACNWFKLSSVGPADRVTTSDRRQADMEFGMDERLGAM
jgi:hypothetical protein